MAARKTQLASFPAVRSGPDFKKSDVEITVEGFKAIHDALTVRLAHLTIIAGINSGGKSSFIQPLLLLKQTLDAGFDPGPLLLHGSNAKFTERSQTLSKGKARGTQVDRFRVQIAADGQSRSVVYRDTQDGFVVESDTFTDPERTIVLRADLSDADLDALEPLVAGFGQALLEQAKETQPAEGDKRVTVGVNRDRCFLEGIIATRSEDGSRNLFVGLDALEMHTDDWAGMIRDIIHVPGLRGNPEREYPRAAVGQSFPGTFDQYVASVILEWGERGDPRLALLSQQMERLGLTWKIFAKRKNDATIEVLVGRMPHAQRGGANDLVSIADVGFGVSQTLPVVVSLLCARAGQIVYIEQPEIHLHPRAQVVLGEILVQAANRGVKVVAETHSSLLIRSLQTELAKKSIRADDVSLNWISRDKDGYADLSVADIDQQGRFGEWPLDFDDVADDADFAYINAIRQSSVES